MSCGDSSKTKTLYGRTGDCAGVGDAAGGEESQPEPARHVAAAAVAGQPAPARASARAASAARA